MPTIKRFEEIHAWQTARQLTISVYQLSDQGTFSHDFGLKDQMRRAAVSIMSNIAEGFESQTQAIFIKYLCIAKASAGELRAQTYVAKDVGYLTETQFDSLLDLADKCSRQISRFISYLKKQPNTRRIREDKIVYEI